MVCRGVTKSFGQGDTRVQVLHGIDLEIPAGEMALLVGPSGCGKTTLISIICGLLDPTEGNVSLFGVEQQKLTGRRLVEFRGRNVGFVFQQYNLLPSLTAAENAAVPLIIQGTPRRDAIARARRALDDVGLGHRADARPAQMSEDSNSGSPSPGHWSTNPDCSSATSRRRPSTRSPAKPLWSCCGNRRSNRDGRC